MSIVIIYPLKRKFAIRIKLFLVPLTLISSSELPNSSSSIISGGSSSVALQQQHSDWRLQLKMTHEMPSSSSNELSSSVAAKLPFNNKSKSRPLWHIFVHFSRFSRPCLHRNRSIKIERVGLALVRHLH